MNGEKKYNIAELLQIYERMIENIREFSMDAEKQLNKLNGYMITDEIASDFSEIVKPYALILFKNEWVTKEFFNLVLDIDNNLDAMSQNKSLWTDKSLVNDNEWEECRKLGNNLLKMLEK